MKTTLSTNLGIGRTALLGGNTALLQNSLPVVLCGFMLFSYSAVSQSWQTVDDFQYTAGQDAANYGLAFAPNGTLFASGLATDPSGLGHGLVMASTDGGNTGSAPIDDYTYAPGYEAWYDGGMAIDSAGNIYVAGEAWSYSGPDPMNHWIVRRSSDGGKTWTTVDDFTGLTAAPNGIAVDSSGNVYVAGIGNPNSSSLAYIWTVRKGVGGTNFTTVDQPLTLSGSWDASANAVFVHPTAGVFAAGYGQIPFNGGTPKSSGTAQGWVVRRSRDSGVTWQTVDTFHLLSTYDARPYGIGTDARGNLYAVGGAIGSGGMVKNKTIVAWNWVVRRSSDGGNSWSTVDDYRFSTTSGHNAASKFVADSNGNLYVAGMGNSDSSNAVTGNWIVRYNPGGTGTWQTVDNYVSGPTDNWVWAMTANASGNVFVGGEFDEGNGWHWLVRRK